MVHNTCFLIFSYNLSILTNLYTDIHTDITLLNHVTYTFFLKKVRFALNMAEEAM